MIASTENVNVGACIARPRCLKEIKTMLNLNNKPHFVRNNKTYIVICSAPDGWYLCDVDGVATMVAKSIVEKALQ